MINNYQVKWKFLKKKYYLFLSILLSFNFGLFFFLLLPWNCFRDNSSFIIDIFESSPRRCVNINPMNASVEPIHILCWSPCNESKALRKNLWCVGNKLRIKPFCNWIIHPSILQLRWFYISHYWNLIDFEWFVYYQFPVHNIFIR